MSPRATVAVFFCLVSLAGGVARASAQDDQQRVPSQSRGAPDFLFGEPHGSIGVRGGWIFARAGSDLFDFVQRQLTLDKKDFNTPALGIDFSIAIKPRVDVAVGFEFSRAGKASEYRDYVDNKLLPITQDTKLHERNISGSVRFTLIPRGTTISRFAWVPRSVVPYVGAGAGALWYKFEQNGDFVDYVDLSVFSDYFSSEGFTPSAHVFGGTDIHLYRVLFLTVEGRYVWAHAKLGKDFIDFDPIDLAGMRLSTGLQVVF